MGRYLCCLATDTDFIVVFNFKFEVSRLNVHDLLLVEVNCILTLDHFLLSVVHIELILLKAESIQYSSINVKHCHEHH